MGPQLPIESTGKTLIKADLSLRTVHTYYVSFVMSVYIRSYYIKFSTSKTQSDQCLAILDVANATAKLACKITKL